METMQVRKGKPPKYLFYKVDGDVFVSKLSEIKEVVNDLELGEVPLRNCFTLGMSSLRGEIISVLSLGSLLSNSMNMKHVNKPMRFDQENGADKRNDVTLIIEHKELKYGLAIDGIKQVGYLDHKQMKESNEHCSVSGHYSVDNRIATVISLKSLLQDQCP